MASKKPKPRSAGLLVYRIGVEGTEFLLGHPGGPFFKNKDLGAWTVFKGELGPDEDPYAAARREFEEETGHPAPEGPPIDLGEIKQKAGKVVRAFALHGDFDPANFVSNTFEMQWPPRSGKTMAFPEIDRAEYFGAAAAKEKLNPAQAAFIDRLCEALAS